MAVARKQTHRSVASVEMPAHSWAADLGPGLASAGADNDPSGIVTYSVAGAQFGYDMLWALVLSYPSIVALQLISARIAVSTGKGLTANMREHYARPLFYLAVARFVLANTFNIAADIVATGAAAQLLWHGSTALYTALGGILSLALQWFVPYRKYARMLKWLVAVVFAYVGVTLVLHLPWDTIVIRSLVPRVTWSEDYFTVLLAVLGTTVSPYLLYSQAERQVEELRPSSAKRAAYTGVRDAREPGLRHLRTDTLLRIAMSNALGLFIIAAAAATLHRLADPRDAAKVLAPLAGAFAPQMLALALFGTALLALPPLAGSAAHAAASAFAWRRGGHRDRRIALTLVVLMVAGGLAGISLSVMSMNPIRILYWSAVLNGMTAAPVMALLVLLCTKRSAVGDLSTHWLLRALAWMGIACMGAAVAARYACKWIS
jgi:NRAMP (natural resistance-associated macrophage protein)-like metal ion transporter